MLTGNQSENRNSKEIILEIEGTHEKQCIYEDKEKAIKYMYTLTAN